MFYFLGKDFIDCAEKGLRECALKVKGSANSKSSTPFKAQERDSSFLKAFNKEILGLQSYQ